MPEEPSSHTMNLQRRRVRLWFSLELSVPGLNLAWNSAQNKCSTANKNEHVSMIVRTNTTSAARSSPRQEAFES